MTQFTALDFYPEKERRELEERCKRILAMEKYIKKPVELKKVNKEVELWKSK